MKKRKVKFRFKLLLLAFFLVYVGVSIYIQQTNINTLLEEQKALSEQYEQTKLEKDRLEHKNEYMNTQDYVENEAREKFGFVYENEYVLTPAEDNIDQPETSEDQQ
jgi:cell division protein FtsB